MSDLDRLLDNRQIGDANIVKGITAGELRAWRDAALARERRLREALRIARLELIQDVEPDAVILGIDAALAETPEAGS